MQPGTARQPEQIDTARGDILADLPNRYLQAGGPQFVKQFGVDQMNLAKIRLVRVARNS